MEINDVKIRQLNYGEWLEASREAEARGLDVGVVTLSKAMDGALTPQQLLNYQPFGDIVNLMAKFNKLNNISVEEEKK